MPPFLALTLWFVLLLALLHFDPAKGSGRWSALWVPLIWLFIVASRLPSQWLGGGTSNVVALSALEEGNALDRIILSLLILLAFGILTSRSFDWGEFFARNGALTALLAFALLSVLWSDFPFVAFKRWFRGLGVYLVILVALSYPRRIEAVRLLVRRLCFVLISLSILLIKYFPEMAKEYNPWTGLAYFKGATTSKNMLGALCLVSGIFFLWDTLTCWGNRKEWRTRWTIGVNVGFFIMTLWLLSLAESATSKVCFALGCLILIAAHSKPVKRHPALLTGLIPVGICLYLLAQFGFGINVITALSQAVGRNPDLTGRTHIWEVVLSTNTNPLFGAGYESFWLGPRAIWVWEQVRGNINEAHNGYLEIYLNLGIVGLLLVAGFLITSYRTICRKMKDSFSLGSLSLTLWTIVLFYNATESSLFNGELLWLIFLLEAITVTERPCASREHGSAYGQRYSEATPDEVDELIAVPAPTEWAASLK
jgi:exopolysaccharide production protein ExoQ